MRCYAWLGLASAMSLGAAPSMAGTEADHVACFSETPRDAAVAACTRLIESGESSVCERTVALINRGVWRMGIVDLPTAIADFDAAILLDRKSAHAFHDRGVARNSMADTGTAIKLNPAFALPYVQRAQAPLSRYTTAEFLSAYLADSKPKPPDPADLAAAFADLDRAARLDPSAAIVFRQRAEASMSKNDSDRALADLDEAIRLDPVYGLAYRARADVLFEKRDFDGALRDYDLAMHNSASPFATIAAQSKRARVLTQLGRLDEAATDQRMAMRLSHVRFDSSVPAGDWDERRLSRQAFTCPPSDRR